MGDMLTVEQARERVLRRFFALPETEVALRDARGRVPARDVVAGEDLPGFDDSAMDGYAVRSADIAGAPCELEVTGEVRAGDPGDVEVVPGTCVRIMTGAPVPPGADTVVQVELTSEHGASVTIEKALPAGANIRRAGEDVRAGDTVLRAGTELGPGEIAMLASLGHARIAVHGAPGVALLVTGDELVPVEERPGPGRLRDSNSWALAALVEEAGGTVVSSERVPDDLDATRDAFRRAAGADVIVSSGGVSVGRYDHVRTVIEELGEIDLWRVAMQPGKPVVLGRVLTTPFLGLPGNPVSVHVCFEQFVRPALLKMRGLRDVLRPVVTARLAEPLRKRPGRLQFARVRLEPGHDGWVARPMPAQGSHIRSSLVGCHGVARFAAEETELAAGAVVEVEVWRLPGDAP